MLVIIISLTFSHPQCYSHNEFICTTILYVINNKIEANLIIWQVVSEFLKNMYHNVEGSSSSRYGNVLLD